MIKPTGRKRSSPIRTRAVTRGMRTSSRATTQKILDRLPQGVRGRRHFLSASSQRNFEPLGSRVVQYASPSISGFVVFLARANRASRSPSGCALRVRYNRARLRTRPMRIIRIEAFRVGINPAPLRSMSAARRNAGGIAIKLGVAAMCLLATGCAVSLAVSNSPDWCPNPSNDVACRR